MQTACLLQPLIPCRHFTESNHKRFVMRTLPGFLVVFFVSFCALCLPPVCQAARNEALSSYVADFTKIPGVTPAEIAAIKAFKEKNRGPLSYGTMLCSESFIKRDGTKDGFSVRLTAMLSTMFGVEFKHAIYSWEELVKALNDKTLDFSGELTATPKRRTRYFMTDAIYDRTIKIFTHREGERLEEIAQRRTLRYAVLEGTVTGEQVKAVSAHDIEIIFVPDYEAAAIELKKGAIDAFLEEAPAVFYFTHHDFVHIEDFFPLVYSPVSMSTANPELAPFISVVQKFLLNGGHEHLNQLYRQGNRAFLHHSFDSALTDAERQHIQQHIAKGVAIPFAAPSNSYPISFYNERENEFQGIALDVIAAITDMTGLRFVPVNSPGTSLPDLRKLAMQGTAHFVAGLTVWEKKDSPLLWPREPFATNNHSALIAMGSHPGMELNQILFSRVGVIEHSVHKKVYDSWFPNNTNTVLFQSSEEAFKALRDGKIDFIMGSHNILLSQTNYREQPDFKAALVFEHDLPIAFAFNPSETLLCSIVEKAQRVIALRQINDRWVRKVFDYRGKMIHDAFPYLIGFIALLGIMLSVIIAVLVKNKRLSKSLEKQVYIRTQELRDKTNELQKQSSMLQTVFSAIPDIIVCRDLNGYFTQCNETFAQYMNIRPEDIVGKTDEILFKPHTEDYHDFVKLDREVIRTGKTMAAEEYIFLPFLNTERLFEIVKAPLIQNGQIVGVMGIARDITERKAIEASAREASQAKGAFLARMSHEIRTPLNAIIGMTRIARTSIDNREKALSSLDEITTASSHLLGILNDVLDISKIEAGKFEIAQEPFKLDPAIREVSSIISQRCKEKFVAFTTNIADISTFSLIGDKLRLNQVLINLLGNAVKFTKPKGTVHFSIAIVKEYDHEVTLAFTCADTGIGMTKEHIAKLFTAFEQADSSIAARFGGTGLGLAISQNLVSLMGSKITATSELGKGSTFRFELTFPKTAVANEQAVCGPIGDINLAGKRILLAEDVDINRIILNEFLADTHVEIEEAVDGQKAVEAFAASAPGYYSLIFMDIQMPNMDGYEATTKIRQLPHPDAKTIPIVAMTANAYQEDISMALAVGMTGHLSKPVDFDLLQQTLASIFPGCVTTGPAQT